MAWTVENVLTATKGRLLRGDAARTLTGISTDSRSLRAGECFVALRGETHDGHRFLADVVDRQAGAIVVDGLGHEAGGLPEGETAVIEVSDTLEALGAIAAFHRRRHSLPVVGITGSNGKTSSKEMVASILAQNHNVLKNQGNFNNLVGVPLTLLSLTPQHDVAVVEMGINVPGEMARLAEMAAPTAGLITNIHPAHLEGLRSLEDIVHEKGLLWKALPPDGLAAVNLDDERLVHFARQIPCRKITFSLNHPSAEVRLQGDVSMDEGASRFQLVIQGRVAQVSLPVLGLHQVRNALAAAAVCAGLGEPLEVIAAGLHSHQPVRQRMQTHRLPGGGLLVDDSYNANPASMLAALETLAAGRGSHPALAILGEMRELGETGPLLHNKIGREVMRLGIQRLITLGRLGRCIAEGAVEAGMDPSHCFHAESHEQIVEFLRTSGLEGHWVLVKGSRGMRMERVVEGILTR